jgi:hypothetical protein
MKLRNMILGFALTVLSVACFGQLNLTTPIPNSSSFAGDTYNAPAYAWSGTVYSGSTGTGAYAITLYSPGVTLPDGRRVSVFGNTTIPPITIGNPGAGTMETVTPSAVSGCNSLNAGAATQGTCTITATFTYAHGRGDYIGSGDAGIQEAINDAGNNGGGQVFFLCDTGVITLATGATTTTYAQGSTGTPGGFPLTCPTTLSPAGAFILGMEGRVVTTITTACTGWELGDGTTAARWTVNNTGLTAGTTAVNTGAAWTTGINVVATGFQIPAAGGKGLVITCAGGNPGAGAIKVRTWGLIPAVSNF